MLTRPLGRTGLKVSEIGFGAASFWGHPAFSEAEAHRLVHRALDLGLTLFDTGPAYSRGRAEGRLGRALAGREASSLVIATKAGTRFEGGRVRRDMSLSAIEASLEESLRRLGLDVLPLVHLHGPAAEELTPDFVGGLERLRRRGLFQSLGVNSFNPEVIDAALAHPQIDTVMVDINVLRPARVGLAARAAAAGKGVLAGMPLAMGHTAPRAWRNLGFRDAWYLARALKNHRADMAAGRRFRFLHGRADITGAQAALAWTLGVPGVSAAIVGTTRVGHLEDCVAASGLALPSDLAARIAAAQAQD
ncbi:MAG: aldo/keto reductase [Phenylobacterium sp.]|uniref:aldo/keto reductase n=1 Tax=Phenylobacterium sp. TaxID=1871053 RepID=UPI0025F88ED2|nr:aldo/keto reductase [Phenylobacterium sp.]MCA6232350.1 aldo/keto reductase [Phenylobacterium sp.]MCA6236095.1 aldo/keto reductase [Phenylobacterium sp.]MCA6251419.1 aldo/keto reductase [Phenylobacterium sp.]MCA6258192.1 aldo/keto reductase [Phenylobacterium sp.]MCA6264402.1 aldo/keto reductase [Phenylobacterium sp.]